MSSPHLWIPSSLARIERVVKGRGGASFIRDDPAAHSQALREAFARSAATFADRRDFDVASDLIVQITTVPTWAANKERQHLRNLGFEIVALSEEQPNVAIARISRETLSKFTKKLNRYADTPNHIGRSNFGAIESITPVGVERKIEPLLVTAAADLEVSCLITLFASLSLEMKQTVANRVATDLREMGKEEVAIHSFANGSVGIAADLTPPEMLRIGEQYMFVRSIESNAEVVVEAAIEADPIPQIIQVDRVRCQTPVVVVDSGVNDAASILAGLVVRSIDELPSGSVGPHMAHGTFVASRVIYGDDIMAVLTRRVRPWCPVIDVQVTGDDGIGNRISQNAADLAEILQRIVPVLAPQAKVFNLSLGITPIADGRYSLLARLIDFLSREHQVLFVIAGGNINDPEADPPTHYLSPNTRVLVPSESLLALTVGAVAKYSDANCVARGQEIAPYSRRGPGADRALKPEVAMHGGNVIWNGQGWTTTPRIAAYGLGRLGTTSNIRLALAMPPRWSRSMLRGYSMRTRTLRQIWLGRCFAISHCLCCVRRRGHRLKNTTFVVLASRASIMRCSLASSAPPIYSAARFRKITTSLYRSTFLRPWPTQPVRD